MGDLEVVVIVLGFVEVVSRARKYATSSIVEPIQFHLRVGGVAASLDRPAFFSRLFSVPPFLADPG
jgi:hypothetical protein